MCIYYTVLHTVIIHAVLGYEHVCQLEKLIHANNIIAQPAYKYVHNYSCRVNYTYTKFAYIIQLYTSKMQKILEHSVQ